MRDSPSKSNLFRLKVWGDNACFTRPEMKVERVSYDVMTPSAARGILEAILWKPAIKWKIVQIDVLNPIKWDSVRRNEVGKVMSAQAECLYIEDNRQQRAGLLLKDVAYVIHAIFEMTERAGDEDSVTKFTEMFIRRAGKGQCHQQPYLGCREFAAKFELIMNGVPSPQPVQETSNLGWILYDMNHDCGKGNHNPHFCNERCLPSFFPATLLNGTMIVNEKEVRK